MSTGTIIGIAAVVVLAVVVLAGGIFLVVNRGGDDDQASSTSSTTESTSTSDGSTQSTDGGTTQSTDDDDPPPSTDDDDPPPSTDDENPGQATIDGQTGTISGQLNGTDSAFHEIEVPAGVSVVLTVTPLDPDVDIVVEGSQETVDDGLRGEPETLSGTGPITETLEVSSYFGDAGRYEITVEVA